MELLSTPGVRSIDMSTKNRSSPLRHVDMALVGSLLALLAFGAVMVYSASATKLAQEGSDPQFFLKRQLVGITIGIAIMLVILLVDYRRYRGWAPALYVGAIVALLGVLTPLGSTVNGASGWYNLPGFQIQPAEIVKPVMVIVLASFAAQFKGELDRKHFLQLLALVAVPLGLIVLQPDIGTAMVYVALMAGIMLVAGAKGRHIAALALVGVIAIWGAFEVGVVEDYQIARMTSFVDPDADPQGAGYNLKQSAIAIGSGGLVGQGLFQGSQTKLSYVPEQHTDFIFTAIGEQLGYVGTMTVLLLYAVIVWRGIRIAMLSRDFYGTLVAVGATSALAAQAFLNIGVTIGVMPITGVTLPFVSYGIGSIITTCILAGLLINVHMRYRTK